MYPGWADVWELEWCRWESTPWQQVVTEAVPWYEAAMRDARYAKERDAVLAMVYQQVC